MKLIVLNLPRTIKENALKKMFKVYGDITDCKIHLDAKTGLSKGYGFVEMPIESEAFAAIENLHSSILHKAIIRVKFAHNND